MRNFREYTVWNNALLFCKQIYVITEKLPKTEQFGIISQIQRASVSISSNIAEGCSRKSEKDFARFIEIALGSAFEIESLLELCYLINYISGDKKDELLHELQIIEKQLNALLSKLK